MIALRLMKIGRRFMHAARCCKELLYWWTEKKRLASFRDVAICECLLRSKLTSQLNKTRSSATAEIARDPDVEAHSLSLYKNLLSPAPTWLERFLLKLRQLICWILINSVIHAMVVNSASSATTQRAEKKVKLLWVYFAACKGRGFTPLSV